MRFSWKWLNELIDLSSIPIKQLEKTLTLAGLEVENIEYRPEVGDHILNISVTANRADVYSMIGLAREVSTLFNIPLNKSIHKNNIKKNISYNNSSIKFQSKNLLNLKLQHIQILYQSPSPMWLKTYLNSCGITSTNILSDICEYINIKWGQDIEILDLRDKYISNIDLQLIYQSQLKDPNINHSILNKLLELKEDCHIADLEMIKYRNSIVSVLGIKSNPDFYCNDNSKSIIVIGQVCKKQYIEQIVQSICHKTTRLKKHLKGITSNDFDYAYNEAINLIFSLNKYELGNLNYSYTYQHLQNKIINIDEKLISHILGPHAHTNMNDSKKLYHKINQILQQLNFDATYNKGIFTVKIPPYRYHDVNRDIDIIEEIVRVYGFDKFMDHLPKYTKTGYISDNSKIIKRIRCILRNFGLHEIIHHSLDKYSIKYINQISIYNPLLEEQSHLKSCLVTELLNALIYNKKQKNLPLEGFEIGKIFYTSTTKDNNIHYKEELRLAGILGNPDFSRQLWSEKKQELTWFQAKGLLEEFFEKLAIKVDWVQTQNIDNKKYHYNPFIYHPYRTAILRNINTQEAIGVFGQLNSKIKYMLNNQYHQYIFEINIKALINAMSKHQHLNYSMKNYSVYPRVTRDISLLIPPKITIQSVINHILNQSNKLVESVEVFNEYSKNDITSKNRYVGFRVTYRSKHRTLNDQDIKKIDNEIQNLLKIKL